MGGGVLLSQLWIKVLCRLIVACVFARLWVCLGRRGENIAIKSVESLCRSELIYMSLFYSPQVTGTSCLFQNCGSLGLDD